MTDRIPKEIMQEAEKTLDLMLCNCREAGDVRQDSIRDIARALLARDQRAAEIAREHIYSVSQWGWADVELEAGNRRAAEIEVAILSYDETRHD